MWRIIPFNAREKDNLQFGEVVMKTPLISKVTV